MKDATMTKADLVEEVVRVTELPRKESETIVETIFESIIQALQSGDKIEIRGFGSFRTPKRIPFFKPSKELKDFVNGPPPAQAAAATPAEPSQS
jgi:integration host factor subunit beta